MGWPQPSPFPLFDEFELEDVGPSEEASGVLEGPLLPLRDLVFFPRMVSPLVVGRDRSIEAVEVALERDEPLIAVAQRDPEVEEVEPEDLYEFGTDILIGRMLRMPDGSLSILAQGRQRVQIVEYIQTEPYIRVRAIPIAESTERTRLTEALMRATLALFEKVVQLNRSMPEDLYVFALNVHEPGWLADLIAQSLSLDTAQRQEILETLDPAARLQRISVLLAKELDVLELEDEIHSRVQQELDRAQREHFLREQMKAIQTELGETDAFTREVNELRERLAKADLPDEVRAQAERELERLAAMPPMAPEVGIIRTYLDWILELPWKEETEDNLDLQHVAEVLESNHYGLPKAKERILEYIAVKKLAPDKMRSPILCFVGPPGTGKTSLGKSIAKALGRNFVRVSLGGVRDEAEIRGHRRTYIGAMPGRIIQTMRRAKTINPVFMLDEVDKLGLDFRGDPAAALLEVLDPEQNHAFSDHYLEVPYDLSKVFFITTANTLDPIPPALRDRMEVIEFPSYIEEEKMEIARRFLIPRQLEEHGLAEHPVRFTDAALRRIIREYTYEAGVRNLEREIASVCRKAARRLAEGKKPLRQVTARMLPKLLGPPRFLRDRAEEKDEVGLATGLAWTEAGGDLMPVEVTLMPGKGTLILTGQLGEVMQESAQAALSYARSRSKELGLPRDLFDKTDIHIHLPEGAIPKDGPSAGITMATALISALTNRAVRRDVGMTGEITLRGRVLPVGGLKEKILAAHRAGLKTVIIPKRNEPDLVEIPRKVRRALKIVRVERMEEVLEVALLPPPEGTDAAESVKEGGEGGGQASKEARERRSKGRRKNAHRSRG
ncbi:MAG TPA: endopeptidase La [Chloroflexi bacterium]|nr:endopeptidase La [Chloroflexota bacterium]